MASATETAFASIRRNKIYAEVARQIQQHILDHTKPGDVLPPERQLARMFGVSRTSVRDAIRHLEAIGLVEPRQGVGTVVRELTGASLALPLTSELMRRRKMVGELLEVRNLIEPPISRRAALHATAAQISDLQQILARQSAKVARGETTIEEDNQFHYRIALAADNSVLLRIVDVLMDLLRETRERSLQTGGRPQKSLAGHKRILAALERRDPAASEKAMQQHLQEIQDIVLSKFS